MTTAETVTNEQLKQKLLDVLATIAPEADLEALNSTSNVREVLDIDSFDFLNFLIGLDEVLGVETPEADYGRLVSLDDMVAYFTARLAEMA